MPQPPPLPEDDTYLGHFADLLRRVAALAPTCTNLDIVRSTVRILRDDPDLLHHLIDDGN
jgi:hypothetical protein